MARFSTSRRAVTQALKISYKHLNRRSKREEKDLDLKQQIEAAHRFHPAYGHRRLAWHLGINHKRILRVMHKFGIKPPRRKIRRHYCTRSVFHCPFTNLIKNLTVIGINQVWCSDVSYVFFQGRFWYLATIEDIFTRQLVGFAFGRHHDSRLVLAALKMAILITGTVSLIFHSDQGTEFMAEAVINFLQSKGVKISVSDKASPWQNGYKESFFGRFKDEFGDVNRFNSIAELMEEIYSQIRYYNQDRIHTALKMPPAVYAAKVSENRLPKRGT